MSTRSRVGERAKHRADVAAALTLYGRGFEVEEIATHLGCTVAKAGKLVAEGMENIPEASAEEILLTAQVRMNTATALAGRLMSHEDPRVALAAARDFVAIEATRVRLTGSNMRPDSPVGDYDLPRR